MKKLFSFVAGLLLISNMAFASGSEKDFINREVNTNLDYFEDVAIGGYDTVEYFKSAGAVLGVPEFNHQWEDATWYFVSEENRDLFAANPDQYAPQFGGYCAYAVANGATAPINPELFTIHNDKLYLNLSESVQARWLRSIDRFIRQGEANWPDVLEN